MKNLKSPFFRFLLVVIGFSFLTLSGCKKPKNDGNDDDIQPMYGVKTSIFKALNK